MSDAVEDPTILPVTEVMVRFDMQEGKEWSKQELRQLVRALEADYGEATRDIVPGTVVLRDKAEQNIAQLSERMFAAHRMRPYMGWGELSARVKRMLGVMEGLRPHIRAELRKVWVGCQVDILIQREEPFELSEYLNHHKDWPIGEKHKKTTNLCEKNESFFFKDPDMGAYYYSIIQPSDKHPNAFILEVMINVFSLVENSYLTIETLDISEDRMREIFGETFTSGALATLQHKLREELK